MLRLTILAILCMTVVSGLQLRRPRLDGRIVGGVQVPIEDHPHQISMNVNGYHYCGGSIISDRWILTAAHCAVGKSPSSVKVLAGTVDNRDSNTLAVSQVIVHEKYSSQDIDFDYALLQLASPLTFGSTIQPIRLIDQDVDTEDGANCTVSGWGNTQSGNEPSNPLRAVNVPKVNQQKCNEQYKSYGGVTDRMICAGLLEGGKDACQGDSGGPLTSDGILIGVVSWGYGCAVPNYAGVYSRVAAARTFIASCPILRHTLKIIHHNNNIFSVLKLNFQPSITIVLFIVQKLHQDGTDGPVPQTTQF